MVVEVMTSHALSQRRACGLIGITRRGLKRAPAEDRNLGLRQRLRELAEERRRWGLSNALSDAAPRGLAGQP
jgi:putative transposase